MESSFSFSRLFCLFEDPCTLHFNKESASCFCKIIDKYFDQDYIGFVGYFVKNCPLNNSKSANLKDMSTNVFHLVSMLSFLQQYFVVFVHPSHFLKQIDPMYIIVLGSDIN